MDFSGNQKVHAPREQVFNALLNPEILKSSIPGCDDAEYVDLPEGRQLKLVITTPVPGFKGPYNVFLKTGEVIPQSRVVITAEPYNDFGTIQATCAIDLSDDPAGTNLDYKAHTESTGKIAAIPDLIIKSSVKNTLEKFFGNLEKQVSTR